MHTDLDPARLDSRGRTLSERGVLPAAQTPAQGGSLPGEPPPLESVRPTDLDVYLFREGTHSRIYRFLGAHPAVEAGRTGTYFATWAPDAQAVAVVGDFNGWDAGADRMAPRGDSGIWERFVPGVGPGALYKYHIRSRYRGYRMDKADPLAFRAEIPPRTASQVWDLGYGWDDGEWMARRGTRNGLDSPIAIYEMHFGSWRRVPEEGNRSLTYREMAHWLPRYLRESGYTHVEFLPLMEHPFYGSWGYEGTGYFAATSRYGTPQELMGLVEELHRNDIGVFLDWVPSHFPQDGHSLGFYDGTHLYEHDDPRLGVHPDWGSYIFNYGRREVSSFLLSSAAFWMDRYHLDGLRVDAVASMLYRDYSRRAGEWIPNRYGGRENLEAIDFLRRLNIMLYRDFPGTQAIAEESTAWPGVSRPTEMGGLGFGLKWDMGWMHDTLRYMSRDPIHRQYHHNDLTFRAIYQFHENFVLALSHDEVVHGKGSLYARMPGDPWQKLAQLRLLYAYQYALPGKKLLFMGGEAAQEREWDHETSLDWDRWTQEGPAGLFRWVRDLNLLYRTQPALHATEFHPETFQWVDAGDSRESTLAFLRRGTARDPPVLVVLNFTPVPRHQRRYPVPHAGRWRELLNSDARDYGGSGMGNLGEVWAPPYSTGGKGGVLSLTLPPLGALFLRPEET